MEDSEVREWVKGKLSEGMNPQEIKEALVEEGYNPSIVDELRQVEEDSESREYSFEDESLERHAEKTEGIKQRLENEMERDWKKGAAGVLGLIVLASVFFAAVPALSQMQNPSPTEVNNSETDTEQVSGQETIVIEDGVATPSRPTLENGENIVFQNKEDYRIRIEFGSDVESLEISPESKKSVQLESVTYYTATPTQGGDTEISGSVVVK